MDLAELFVKVGGPGERGGVCRCIVHVPVHVNEFLGLQCDGNISRWTIPYVRMTKTQLVQDAIKVVMDYSSALKSLFSLNEQLSGGIHTTTLHKFDAQVQTQTPS